MKLCSKPRIQLSSGVALLVGVTVGCTSAPASSVDGSAGHGDEAAGAMGDAGAGNAGRGGSAGTANGAGGSNGDNAGAAGLDAGGSAGTGGSGGTGDAGPAAINGCVKALGLWFVVRNDGHVLLEERDKTKEATILGPDAKALTGAVDVTGGNGYGCALLGDGTVWCWQEVAGLGNRYGQLGGGTTDSDLTAPIERASQVLVAAGQPLTNVAALAKGTTTGAQTCAITNDGELSCWGDLTWLVNDGTAVVSSYAQAVTADGFSPFTGVVQASISSTMACAVVDGSPNHSLYCWGANSDSNLGTGDANTRQYPTKVTTLTSPTRVAVFPYGPYLGNVGGTACVLDGDQVLCWGMNSGGLTGTGKTDGITNTPTPVVTADGTTPLPRAIDILSGTNGTFCALESNQTLWCWGSGFKTTAANYGLTNVSLFGGLYPVNGSVTDPLFLTTDGTYHWGMEWSRSPDCAP